jgi:hypothetical protein
MLVWQASQEVEEVACNSDEEPLRKVPAQARKELKRIRVDTLAGMAVSNLVAFSIILTTARKSPDCGRQPSDAGSDQRLPASDLSLRVGLAGSADLLIRAATEFFILPTKERVASH